MNRHEQFTVLGKPFFTVGAQAHNSTRYVLSDLRISFDAVKKLNGNSCAVTICWDRFEPEEGVFEERAVACGGLLWSKRITREIREKGKSNPHL